MTRQEFLDSFTQWMNEMANKMFPTDIINVLPFVEKEKITPFKAKVEDVRLSSLAGHFRTTSMRMRELINESGIDIYRARGQREDSVRKSDIPYLNMFLEKKYNLLND